MHRLSPQAGGASGVRAVRFPKKCGNLYLIDRFKNYTDNTNVVIANPEAFGARRSDIEIASFHSQ